MLTIGARLANASTNAPIAGVPVTVTLTADTTFGPCGGTFGAATPMTNASGEISVSLPISACYLGSRAVATVAVTSDGLFGSNQTLVGVNLLGYFGFLGPVSSYPADISVYIAIMGAAIGVGYVLEPGPPLEERWGVGERPMFRPPPANPSRLPLPPRRSTLPSPAELPGSWVVNPRPPDVVPPAPTAPESSGPPYVAPVS